MPKKKASGKNYTSKGERPNVNKKTRNAVRAHRQATRPVERLLARLPMEQDILKKVSKNQRMSDDEKIVYEKMMLRNKADSLYAKWKKVATYAACMQAVKTDYVPTFEANCHERQKQGLTID